MESELCIKYGADDKLDQKSKRDGMNEENAVIPIATASNRSEKVLIRIECDGDMCNSFGLEEKKRRIWEDYPKSLHRLLASKEDFLPLPERHRV